MGREERGRELGRWKWGRKGERGFVREEMGYRGRVKVGIRSG